MSESKQYTEELYKIRSLLIVTSLQKRRDIEALELIKKFSDELSWNLEELTIDKVVWEYVLERGYDPKEVFCHPKILLSKPVTSLYYRGLSGLSIKTAKNYIGSIENLEKGNPRARITEEKALRISQTYNKFICFSIKGSEGWTLENGYRTIIATMGISIDGTMRNRIGEIAEKRIRLLIVEWLIDNGLIVEPELEREVAINEMYPDCYLLKDDVEMSFGSEPDISFKRGNELISIIEIKGGVDPAGALERYGAATKSFQEAIRVSSMCKNIYLGAVFTDELKRRIELDRLVDSNFDIVRLLEDSEYRTGFFRELFHHILRITDQVFP